MTAPRVAIVGAGVVGLACALRLQDEGWEASLHDEGAETSASGVAAGMLAPASEALLDGAGPFPMLRAARDLWADLDPPKLSRAGALHLAPEDELAARHAALTALGGRAELVEGAYLATLWPRGLAAPPPGLALFTPEDWRLAAGPALATLRARAVVAGVAFQQERVAPGQFTPAALRADAVVLAAGWGAAAFVAAAPEARLLSPVKGQLLRFPGAAPFNGPVVRTPGGYLAPDAAGLQVGATMEPGRADAAPDAAAEVALRRVAADVDPALAAAAAHASAGVRAVTPDGRPLVGPSASSGLWWAAGMRRNGWLLAPLVAQVLAAHLCGRDPGPWAGLLHPRRFDPDFSGDHHRA